MTITVSKFNNGIVVKWNSKGDFWNLPEIMDGEYEVIYSLGKSTLHGAYVYFKKAPSRPILTKVRPYCRNGKAVTTTRIAKGDLDAEIASMIAKASV